MGRRFIAQTPSHNPIAASPTRVIAPPASRPLPTDAPYGTNAETASYALDTAHKGDVELAHALTIANQHRIPRVSHNSRNKDSEVWYSRKSSSATAAEPDRGHHQREEQHPYEFKRDQAERREDTRWANLALAEQHEAQRAQDKRMTCRSGESGAAYDILSSQVTQNKRGEDLTNSETAQKEKSRARAELMYMRMNTYNPISGENITHAPGK